MKPRKFVSYFFRKVVICIAAGSFIFCPIPQTVSALEQSEQTHLAPRSKLKEVISALRQASLKRSQEAERVFVPDEVTIAWEIPQGDRKAGTVLPHVNLLRKADFTLPGEVSGGETVNLIDVIYEALKRVRLSGGMHILPEDFIVNIAGSTSYFHSAGKIKWTDIGAFEIRLYGTVPIDDSHSIRMMREIEKILAERKVQTGEPGIILPDGGGAKHIRIVVRYAPDADLLADDYLAGRYDPLTYYTGTPRRLREMGRTLSRKSHDEVVKNMRVDYQRCLDEAKHQRGLGTGDSRERIFKHLVRLYRMRGMDDMADDVLLLSALPQAGLSAGEGDDRSDREIDKHLRLLDVSFINYEQVDHDISHALLRRYLSTLLREMAADASLAASPRKARTHLSRHLSYIPELRNDVLRLFRPMSAMPIAERLRILASFEKTRYVAREDLAKLLKLAGISLRDIVRALIDNYGRETDEALLRSQIAEQTGFTDGEVGQCIQDLIRRKDIAAVYTGDARSIFPLKRYVEYLRNTIRDGPLPGAEDSRGSPSLIKALGDVPGEKQAAVRAFLVDVADRFTDPRDAYDLLTNGYYLPELTQVLSSSELSPADAEGVIASLRVLRDVRGAKQYDALMHAYGIVNACFRDKRLDDLSFLLRVLADIAASDLEMRNQVADQLTGMLEAAKENPAGDLQAAYGRFMEGLRVDRSLAAAFFILGYTMSEGDAGTLASMKNVLSGMGDVHPAYLEQLMNAIVDVRPYMRKRRILFARFLGLLESGNERDTEKIIRLLNQIYIICEYENYKRVPVIDTKAVVSLDTFDDMCRLMRNYLKQIDSRPKEISPCGALLCDLIAAVNEDTASDAARSQYVFSAHPAVSFDEGLIPALVRMNLDVRPSPRGLDAYGKKLDMLQKPIARRSAPARILGRVACAIGLLDGNPVLFIGEVQGLGYWNLPDEIKTKTDRWHLDAVRRLEQKARDLGIKTVLLTHPQVVQDHYLLSDTNAGKYYQSFRKIGYKDSRKNLLLELPRGEAHHKFFVKQLILPEMPPAPDMPWICAVDPSIENIEEISLVRDIVEKEKEALPPELLLIDHAERIVRRAGETRHEGGNRISSITGNAYLIRMKLQGKLKAIAEGRERGVVPVAERLIGPLSLFIESGNQLSEHLAVLDKEIAVQDADAAARIIAQGRELAEKYRALYENISADLIDLDDSTRDFEDPIRRHIATMHAAMDGLKRHIDDFAATVNDEPLVEKIEKCDLKSFLEDFIDTLKVNKTIRDAEIAFACPDDVPPVYVDKGRLDSALLNMARNAAHALRDVPYEEKKFAIRVKTADDNRTVVIDVEDTGKGIPETLRDKVFDRYATFGKGTEGTGLGLWISKNTVNSAMGTIDVFSKPGKGTRFEIRIPAAEVIENEGLIQENRLIQHAVNLAALSTLNKLSDADDPFLRALADHHAAEIFRAFMDRVSVNAQVRIGSSEEEVAGRMVDGEKLGAGGKPVDIIPDLIQLSRGIAMRSFKDTVSMAIFSERDRIMRVPYDLYMRKIIVGKNARDADIDVSKSMDKNLQAIAKAITSKTALPARVTSLRGAVLFRNRHKGLIRELISSGIKMHRTVNAYDETDFGKFWDEVAPQVEKEGVYQSGNMIFLADGDIMPVFGLRFGAIDFVCGAGGAREGIISAALTEIFDGKMSAQLCAKEAADETRAGVDERKDAGEFSEREKRALAAGGFVPSDRADADIREGEYRWNHVFSAGTLVKSQDIAVIAAGIKDSMWIRGLKGVEFDSETGEKTVYTLQAAKNGDIRILKTVYGADVKKLRDQIAAGTDPAVKSAAQYRLGEILCLGGNYQEGIEMLSQAVSHHDVPYEDWQRYEAARRYYDALAVFAEGTGEDRYARALSKLYDVLSVDPADHFRVQNIIGRCVRFQDMERMPAFQPHPVNQGMDAYPLGRTLVDDAA